MQKMWKAHYELGLLSSFDNDILTPTDLLNTHSLQTWDSLQTDR